MLDVLRHSKYHIYFTYSLPSYQLSCSSVLAPSSELLLDLNRYKIQNNNKMVNHNNRVDYKYRLIKRNM